MIGTVAGMARKTHLIFAFAGALLAAEPLARPAETVSLAAHLLAARPSRRTKATRLGRRSSPYDSQTRQLDYYVTYDGASPTRIDIHGPAGPGETAMAIASFPLSESPVTGKTILTREQGDSLLAGKLYVDLHSQAYANGEIRGQIGKQ